jgi:integrase
MRRTRDVAHLTDDFRKNARVPPGKAEHVWYDDEVEGFVLRGRAAGSLTFYYFDRLGLENVKIPIKVDRVSKARELARTYQAQIQLGIDPRREKARAVSQATVTAGRVIADYLDDSKGRLSEGWFKEVERYLLVSFKNLHKLPIGLADDPVAARAIVATEIARIGRENGKVSARAAFAVLSAFYRWAVGAGRVAANPLVGAKKPKKPDPRERVLDKDELLLVLLHAGEGDYGDIVRLDVFTGGQRREIIGALRWFEVDLERGELNISGERTKNRKPYIIPLTEPALRILRARPRREGREFVFGKATGPFQGWSNGKEVHEARINAALAARGLPPMKPWRLHDIRRTTSTHMADNLKIQPHIIEAIQHRISGHQGGVAGVYNRALYLAEKRKALDTWADHIEALVEGRECKIVPLVERAERTA